ncbi:DUF5712 family protein [Bacteroides thetaiotaomicron]|uniref:DUF5712 family protein n=1 Tax=Bacteroides thetaiotaomicron TaxID=818 RepID=UPI003568EA59
MPSSIKDTLIKTDAKFFAIHVSPSEKELQAMGSTGQETAEAMKRYIREVFILEYAKNFNKESPTTYVRLYGKIHFAHNCSGNNGLNMYCHLIVGYKDQANKRSLSPFTNCKNIKKETVMEACNHVNLF